MDYANAAYIYEIVNTVNGKRYIGSTICKPRVRWNTHKSRLRNGNHHSYKLQSAWNSFKEEAFSFNILLVCEKSEALYYERELIRSSSYNIVQDPSTKGIERRWEGHIKQVKNTTPTKDKSVVTAESWKDPNIRQKRIDGIRLRAATPENKARRKKASTGRKMSKESVSKSARAKWKPIFCPELGISFLCQKYAAEYLGVLHTSVANAVKNSSKVCYKYTLLRVA